MTSRWLMSRTGADTGLDARLRAMRIVWAAQLATVGVCVIFSRFARSDKPGSLPEGFKEIAPLLYTLAAMGLAAVVASFVLKSVYYRRAAERQQPAQAQTGFVLALAMCEGCVVFGLMGLFVTWNDYAYLLFALGALGMLLHFPRRGEVLSSSKSAAG